ncbi:class I SAM-dependent methyltransferase [uncultured Gimesia sp.]|uniref:class I SAM-dependent methyltransferase n=1 Tax=uncultured Gimesia sp. TaxID=1678688 RepID=UPI00261EBF0F|nr:class I SAM-dependent methyltransferase [uncultured Gimesia sp.]
MSKNLFQGTVPYYTRYRLPYPEPLLAEIREQANVSGQGRLLDLGCGTGKLALPLSSFFQQIVALDIDSEMLAAAKQKAGVLDVQNIIWLNERAEQFTSASNSFELLTIGAAFHWMDRKSIAKNAREWLLPGQPMVVLGYTSIWSGTADWHALVRNVLQKWLGAKRRAGSGEYDEALDPHELVLINAGYTLDEIEYQHSHTWTLDELIGNLYSTSFASPAVLGDDKNGFEADLRETLLDYQNSGTYQEEMTFYSLLAYPN